MNQIAQTPAKKQSIHRNQRAGDFKPKNAKPTHRPRAKVDHEKEAREFLLGYPGHHWEPAAGCVSLSNGFYLSQMTVPRDLGFFVRESVPNDEFFKSLSYYAGNSLAVFDDLFEADVSLQRMVKDPDARRVITDKLCRMHEQAVATTSYYPCMPEIRFYMAETNDRGDLEIGVMYTNLIAATEGEKEAGVYPIVGLTRVSFALNP